MKKKIKIAFAIMLIFAASYSSYSSYHVETQVANLFFDNIEALASESGGTQFWCCGNCCVCAKGSNIVIHGHLQKSPC